MIISDPHPHPEGSALSVSGRLDAHTAGGLRGALQEHLNRHPGHLWLDLSQVAFMDSSALAAVVGTLKTLRARGDELHLSGASPAVRELLSLTMLDRVLPVQDLP